MSLLLAIVIGLGLGALDSLLMNKARRLIGAVSGLLIGFFVGSGNTDAMTISAFGALTAAVGALIVSLLFNVLAHGYTDPNGPTEMNGYDADPK